MPNMHCTRCRSTTKHFVKMVRAAADSTCEHKKLMPYRPNAPRNRPKETVRNGMRPCVVRALLQRPACSPRQC